MSVLKSRRLLWGLIVGLASLIAVAAALDPALPWWSGVVAFAVMLVLALVMIWADR